MLGSKDLVEKLWERISLACAWRYGFGATGWLWVSASKSTNVGTCFFPFLLLSSGHWPGNVGVLISAMVGLVYAMASLRRTERHGVHLVDIHVGL